MTSVEVQVHVTVVDLSTISRLRAATPRHLGATPAPSSVRRRFVMGVVLDLAGVTSNG